MHTIRKIILSFTGYLMVGLVLTACATAQGLTSGASESTPSASAAEAACPVTEAEGAVHLEDSAILGTPAFGYYIINPDRSIWAGASWFGDVGYPLREGEEGNKVGWFRPAGADLIITGHRLDGDAPPLEAEASCCYPTRFQASGLIFPTEGCWEINAKAAESELTFVVWVQP
jgi:hypothetical protein